VLVRLKKGELTIERKVKNRNRLILTFAVFAAFAVFGFTDGARGPAIPRIQAELGVTELQLGLLLAVSSAGYLSACYYTAAIAKKTGVKACLVAALLLLTASGALICFSSDFTRLVISFFVLNSAYGVLEISLGVIAATLFTKRTGTMLNLAHFFYGAGAVVSPLVTTGLMAARFGSNVLGWRYAYLVIFSFALLPLIPTVIGRLGRQAPDEKKSGYLAFLKQKAGLMTIMIMAFGLTCENGSSAWLVNYLEKACGYTGEQAALRLTLFYVCFTLARLLLGPVTDKFGLINSLAAAAAFSGAAIVAGVLCGRAGSVLLVLSGAGIALIFPTVMAVIAKLFLKEIDRAVTVVMTVTGTIMIPASLLTGMIIQRTREFFSHEGTSGVMKAYSAGYLFIGLCCLGAFVFALLLRREQKKLGRLV